MIALNSSGSAAVTIILFALLLSAGIGRLIGRTKGRAREGALWGLLGVIGWIVIAFLPPKLECPHCQQIMDPRYPWMHNCGGSMNTPTLKTDYTAAREATLDTAWNKRKRTGHARPGE